MIGRRRGKGEGSARSRAFTSRGLVAPSLSCPGLPATRAGAGEDLGLLVLPGFRVKQDTDKTWAIDIFAVTLDPKGGWS